MLVVQTNVLTFKDLNIFVSLGALLERAKKEPNGLKVKILLIDTYFVVCCSSALYLLPYIKILHIVGVNLKV